MLSLIGRYSDNADNEAAINGDTATFVLECVLVRLRKWMSESPPQGCLCLRGSRRVHSNS